MSASFNQALACYCALIDEEQRRFGDVWMTVKEAEERKSIVADQPLDYLLEQIEIEMDGTSQPRQEILAAHGFA